MTRIRIKPGSHGKTRIGTVYLNLGSDGDQWFISPTKNGGVIITHVPPRQPVTAKLTTVASMLVKAGRVTGAEINKGFGISATTGQQVMSGIVALGAKESE